MLEKERGREEEIEEIKINKNWTVEERKVRNIEQNKQENKKTTTPIMRLDSTDDIQKIFVDTEQLLM